MRAIFGYPDQKLFFFSSRNLFPCFSPTAIVGSEDAVVSWTDKGCLDANIAYLRSFSFPLCSPCRAAHFPGWVTRTQLLSLLETKAESVPDSKSANAFLLLLMVRRECKHFVLASQFWSHDLRDANQVQEIKTFWCKTSTCFCPFSLVVLSGRVRKKRSLCNSTSG